MDENNSDIYYQNPMSSSKKSNKLKVFIVVAILVISAVTGVLYFFVFSNNDSQRIIGIWEVNMSVPGMGSTDSSTGYWIFYENGSAKGISISDLSDIEIEETFGTNSFNVTSVGGISESWLKYEIKNDKLYLKPPEGYESSSEDSSAFGSSFGGEVGLKYEFKNDDRIEISFWIMNLVLTRVKEDSIPTDTLEKTKWGEINITVNVGWNSEDIPIHMDWINLTRSDISYSGNHCPSEWGAIQVGDTIEIGVYGDNIVRGNLIWMPDPDIYMPSFHFY